MVSQTLDHVVLGYPGLIPPTARHILPIRYHVCEDVYKTLRLVLDYETHYQ